jgi:hypothetical protein
MSVLTAAERKNCKVWKYRYAHSHYPLVLSDGTRQHADSAYFALVLRRNHVICTSLFNEVSHCEHVRMQRRLDEQRHFLALHIADERVGVGTCGDGYVRIDR